MAGLAGTGTGTETGTGTPQNSYYYQIGSGSSDNEGKNLDEWRTTDLGRLSKNTCMNVRDAGFKRSGSKAMDKDDNLAMFVPKGYAILGYDHDNCKETVITAKSCRFFGDNCKEELQRGVGFFQRKCGPGVGSC